MKQYKKLVKDSTIVLNQIKDTDRYKGNIEVGNKLICNPTEKQLVDNGWKEVIQPTPPPYVPPTEEEIAKQEQEQYEQRVESKIRQKYSVGNELAILRQRDTKSLEFSMYNDYCEQCKREVKQEIIQEKKELEEMEQMK